MKTRKNLMFFVTGLMVVFCSGCVSYLVTTPTEVVKSAFKKKCDIRTSDGILSSDQSRVYVLELKVPLKTLHEAEGPEKLFFWVIARSAYDPSRPCRYRIFQQEIHEGKKIGKRSLILEWQMKQPRWFRYRTDDLFFSSIKYISNRRLKNDAITYKVQGEEAGREQFITVLEEKILSQIDSGTKN